MPFVITNIPNDAYFIVVNKGLHSGYLFITFYAISSRGMVLRPTVNPGVPNGAP